MTITQGPPTLRVETKDQPSRCSSLTVLFTDVAGSTVFPNAMGDSGGAEAVEGNDRLAAIIENHNGQVSKTIGSSMMAEFSDAASAVRAGIEMERQLAEANRKVTPDKQRELRIGIHAALGQRGIDVFGGVVDVAAGITRRAARGQILVSRAVYEGISQESDLHCQWSGTIALDGRTDKEDI